jgi:hypothetical protein
LIIAPYATPVADPWENFLSTRALENGVFLAACNHVGPEGEWQMSGKSMIITPRGKIAVQASPSEEQIISLDITREDVFAARRSFPLFRDRRPDAYSVISTADRGYSVNKEYFTNLRILVYSISVFHAAIIMDGNGRWAQSRGLSRLAGHRHGVEAIRRIVRAAPGLAISDLTLYAFSSDNWRRPADESAGILGLIGRVRLERRGRTCRESHPAHLHRAA